MNESVKGDSSLGGGRISRFPRGGRLLGPLFGLIFLIYPIQAVFTSDPTLARVLFALGGAGLFTGVFLWLLWMHEPLPSAAAGSPEARKRRAAIVFLALLAVLLNITLGSEWRVLFFHVNVAAGLMLMTRDAYVAIAALAAITLALGITSGMAWLVLPTVVLGLWATAFVRQVEAVADYRRPTLAEELAGASEMLQAAGIACRIENGAGVLPNAIDAVLAWAVREGTTNVIRHSRATRCRIILARD